MTLPLSHFPDLCLLRMFKYIPLVDMIRTVGLVCKNWARVHRGKLKRRHSLSIVQDCSKQLKLKFLQKDENPFGSDLIEHVRREDESPWWKCRSLDKIKFETLQTSQALLPVRCLRLLIEILPNITHLTLIQNCVTPKTTVSTLKQMTQMISHYATRLIFLKVDLTYLIGNELKNEARHVNALLNAIHQVSSLRHLHLSINPHHPTKVALNLEAKLTILAQLNTFVLDHFDNSKLFRDSLRQYATGDVRVTMKQKYSLKELLLYDEQLASKFNGIRIYGVIDSNYDMQLLCSRFVSLSTLELSIKSIEMTMFAQCLSPLNQLVHLKLYGNLQHQLVEHNEQNGPQQIVQKMAEVPSVCLLTLTISCPGFRCQREQLYITKFFPKLQVLHFNYLSGTCYHYHVYYHLDIEGYEGYYCHPHKENTMCLIQQQFRKCPNLHTIKLDFGDEFKDMFPRGLITIDQL